MYSKQFNIRITEKKFNFDRRCLGKIINLKTHWNFSNLEKMITVRHPSDTCMIDLQ